VRDEYWKNLEKEVKKKKSLTEGLLEEKLGLPGAVTPYLGRNKGLLRVGTSKKCVGGLANNGRGEGLPLPKNRIRGHRSSEKANG